jgi:serine/threonine-protein kinase
MAEGIARAELPARIGRYPVLGYLADGGMAEIFVGRDPERGAIVIKRILPHLARQGNFVAMFIDEARIGSLVRHPNVVEVHELGQVGTDLFLVMEYLAGESVSGLMRRAIARGEHFSPALGAFIIAEACAGLHAAHILADEKGHPLGLVHRDVSLSNVFVTYRGDVKVLDFGIATAAHRLTRTATGQVKGKFSYMSPEQCRGEVLDLRSDIFSLGVVLYELTVQRRLFKRPNELMVLKAVTEESIPRPRREVPGYPDELERIVMKAVAREKWLRHVSALELREELLAVLPILPGGLDPKTLLADTMKRLFAERIAEKQEMMRHVRMGTDLHGVVPAGEVDELVEVPQMAQHTATVGPATPVASAAPSRSRWPALLLLLAIAGAAVWWFGLREDADLAAPPAASHPAAQPSKAGGFALHVDSIPRGAAVYIDGAASGVTPLDVPMTAPRTLALRVELAGYMSAEQQLALDHDEQLLIPLAPMPAAPAPAPSAAPTPDAASPAKGAPGAPIKHGGKGPKPSDPFQRFD